MNLSAPFIMEIPPFKAVLVNTLPNDDELSGNVAEATTFAETEAWDEKDVASIAKKFAAQGANSAIVCVGGQTGHRVSHHRISQEEACRGRVCRKCHRVDPDTMSKFLAALLFTRSLRIWHGHLQWSQWSLTLSAQHCTASFV